MNRRNFLKGLAMATTVAIIPYELRPIENIIEVPIKNARFLTVDQVIVEVLKNYREVLAKNITENQSVFMAMKRQGWISK